MEVVEWVEDIDELAELFERQEGLGRRRVRGICGRVTKGRTEDDFRLLSDGPTKRLSWVVGPDGLEQLCGKSPRDMLLAIGKDTPWLRRTLDKGYRFRLCLFPEVQARQATWDGVLELVRDAFPEAWPHVEPHAHLLPKYTLEEVQARFTEFDIHASFREGRDHHHFMTLERLCLFPEVQARQATWDGVLELVRDAFPEAWPHVEPHAHLLPKYTLEEVQARFTEFDIHASFREGRDHHHFMTLERYLKSSGSLGHTRAFLYHEVGLSQLFHGDGFTRTEDGQVGLREYLVPNRPLTSFAKHRSVELPLDLDQGLPPDA
ncbi:uncharacterized protein ACA1_086530 [Acanthamoeba castellanii str. Neff]|uniref:Uncharacterized protein n=1 Tax=Acanthamoeba castellanii (strain ATCC 30010 / Neff) TaxID=1257118 RepID=L8GQY5_ACACF|nr:uncharacterized protein ACA1_086530 [Acanthamoeba castellanii str. Neff]ELR15337.1 hypothetical protein ACA1_086530 [Acanthamoeba castellanii str. Neff]